MWEVVHYRWGLLVSVDFLSVPALTVQDKPDFPAEADEADM